MKHEDYREMISFYIDDLLSENEKQDFESHIEGCSVCREELEEMKLVISGLSEMTELDLPVGFEEELKAKLLNTKLEISGPVILESAGANIKKNKNGFRWKYIYSTAAALMLIVAGTAYFNSELHFMDRAAKNAAPVASSKTENQNPNASTFDISPTSEGGASAKMLAPTECLKVGSGDGKIGTPELKGANTGASNKNKVGDGTNVVNENRRTISPTPTDTTTPEITPANDAVYSMMKTPGKEVWIGSIKIGGDNGKYQPWADKIIKEAGGTLISTGRTDVDQRYEYELTLENFWVTYDSITVLDAVKSAIGVDGMILFRTDDVLDKTEEYGILEKTAKENTEAGTAAAAKLKELENALLKAKIVIIIHN